jgi:hypothetical protein
MKNTMAIKFRVQDPRFSSGVFNVICFKNASFYSSFYSSPPVHRSMQDPGSNPAFSPSEYCFVHTEKEDLRPS